MARPKKNVEDIRKNKIFMRLTDKEYAKLKEMLKYDDNKNLSELLRNYLFKN